MKVATKYVLWLAGNLLGALCLWKIKREVAAQRRRPKASSTSTFSSNKRRAYSLECEALQTEHALKKAGQPFAALPSLLVLVKDPGADPQGNGALFPC